MLCLSVWAAVKHALSCINKDSIPGLNLPATAEEILQRIVECNKSTKENSEAKQSLGESEVYIVNSYESNSRKTDKSVNAKIKPSIASKIVDCIDI